MPNGRTGRVPLLTTGQCAVVEKHRHTVELTAGPDWLPASAQHTTHAFAVGPSVPQDRQYRGLGVHSLVIP